ncbi:MAG: orotate phosphoribosyltransferase [Alphaproteobacteria bacterium]|nr:orotate phosphoribosyltransferase [Alphaproteobacteria bacterium]
MKPSTESAGKITAEILLRLEAIGFRPEEPFQLTSGWASPVYVDCRKLISFPEERRRILDLAVATLTGAVGKDAFDAIAGGETAGIPYAAWLAERMDLPMLYVRKKPKGFGRMAQIEGHFEPGARVLLVEDLATDGKSKLHFCEALRAAGAEISHAFVVFHYGIFPEGVAALKAAGITLHALATWWDVLEAASREGTFPETTLREVRAFLEDPGVWRLLRFEMPDPDTIRRLLDEIEALQDELAPPEQEIFEELRLRYAKAATPVVGDDRSLEVILRNVAVRRQMGLKLKPDGNGS